MMCQRILNELKRYSKCYSTDLKRANVDTLLTHVFCKPSFTNYFELTEHLVQNVIYQSKDLLILNRPHGLRKEEIREREFWQKKLKLHISPSLAAIDSLNFTGVLPHLKKKLELNYVKLLKAPDRYMSGISILACDRQNIENRVTKALSPPDLPKYTFLAVCDGISFCPSNSQKLGVTLIKRGESKKITFVKNYSKRSLEKKIVFPFVVNYNILSTNDKLQISLVEIKINKNKWNSLRAFCAMRLVSPIIGDNLFGSYVQEINKTKIALDPFSPAASRPYKLRLDVLNALELTPKEQSVVPLHIHLAELDFLKYRGDGRTFTAKPPDYFLWTCRKLKLDVPKHYMENRVSESSRKCRKKNGTIEENVLPDDDDDEETTRSDD